MAMPVKMWCALAFIVVAACARAPATNIAGGLTGSAAEGRAVAADLCAGCHAIDAVGESPLASAPPFRTILSKYESNVLAADLQSGVLMNHPDLPYVYLSDQSARAVVAYLETLPGE